MYTQISLPTSSEPINIGYESIILPPYNNNSQSIVIKNQNQNEKKNVSHKKRQWNSVLEQS